ncbi:hypothetical protein [Streptomyces carpinensis]|uniref:DUF4352 domain-containing protein n=1 Tax=Streptomyces carpinensis TaxID=66369 RepID=A0ABV1VVT6_9ACTN|nr:hypothetical protein [Streptomyces carpinensis]
MRTRIWLAGIAVAAAALTGCNSTDTSSATSENKAEATAPAKAPKADLAKRDVKIVRTGFENHPTWGDHAYVTHYTITNHGTGAADYFVSLDYLDADGDVLGSTGVTAEKLGVGKTNTGDTAPLEAEISNGKIADIKSVRVTKVERTDPM